MPNIPLFRSAALDSSRANWLGEIVLIRPLSIMTLSLGSIVIALLVICFFAFASYSKRSTVSGVLTPDIGVLKMYSSQPGVVARKLVKEGQRVKKGDVLFVISIERQSNRAAGVQSVVSQQVALREQSIRDELAHTRTLQEYDENALHRKIDGLQAEASNIAHQIAGQRLRVELSESGFKRASELLAQGYVSAEMAQQKQADLLDQRNRLQMLERDQISIDRELQVQRSQLVSLPIRQKNEVAQIERLLVSASQEWTESEGKRQNAVVSPEDGIATGAVAEVGQAVDGSRPLVSILPSGAVLQAQLYAPSRAVGFIRRGDQVLLRYQAFPYQKFGHSVGTVVSVSRTALAPSEITNIHPNTGSSEPIYLITVELARQTVTAYGEPRRLHAGMLLEGDILQEKRKLYEWVLEPLYSMSGKL